MISEEVLLRCTQNVLPLFSVTSARSPHACVTTLRKATHDSKGQNTRNDIDANV